jgi:hypothetical protein
MMSKEKNLQREKSSRFYANLLPLIVSPPGVVRFSQD